MIVIADEAHRSQYDTLARNLAAGAAQRDPDRVHRHADRARRQVDARDVRRLHQRLPHGARRRPTAPPSRSTTSRDRSPSTSTATRSSTSQQVLDSEADEAQTELSRRVRAHGRDHRRARAAGPRRRRPRRALHRPLPDACRARRWSSPTAAASPPSTRCCLRERLGEDAVDGGHQRAGHRRPADQRLPQEQAAAQGGRGALQGPRLRRCASSSSRTCG